LSEKINLSRLTPEQLKQLEDVLSNLVSSARTSTERPKVGLDLDHSSHASG
jgi:hypothetical protein